MAVANTLAYYDTATITARRRFVVRGGVGLVILRMMEKHRQEVELS